MVGKISVKSKTSLIVRLLDTLCGILEENHKLRKLWIKILKCILVKYVMAPFLTGPALLTQDFCKIPASYDFKE